MSLLQTIKLVLGNIKSNKLRTFLTMLGIIIGVAAVIVMVSMIQGFIDKQTAAFGKMGINNISLNIKSNAPPKITTEDIYNFADEHKDVFKGVTQTTFMASYNLNVKKENELSQGTEYTQARGIDEKYVRLLNQKIKAGRDFCYADVLLRKKVCIVGAYVEQRAFVSTIHIGDFLNVNGVKYEVIGILDEIQGNINQEYAQWGADNVIYFPVSVVERMPPGEGTEVSLYDDFGGEQSWGDRNYQFVGEDVNSVSKGAEIVRTYMKENYSSDKMYSISDNSSMLGEINGLRATSSLVAGGIGMISLFVAGIGIMNIMLVSVTERTKEIGIRKSLGAKRRDIRWQFILEAGITGGLGGLMGIALGMGAMLFFAQMMKISPTVNISTVIISFSVSVGVGMIFGFLPANKAARLNPIDALRSE